MVSELPARVTAAAFSVSDLLAEVSSHASSTHGAYVCRRLVIAEHEYADRWRLHAVYSSRWCLTTIRFPRQ